MTAPTDGRLRRLRDYPGVADLERRAAGEDLAGLEAAAERLRQDLFAVTAAELRRGPGAGAGGVDAYAACALPPDDQVAAFRRHGWDVTAAGGAALRILPLINQALLAACLGLAGRLPESPEAETWGASLQAEAMRFRSGGRTRPATVVRRGPLGGARPGPLRRP